MTNSNIVDIIGLKKLFLRQNYILCEYKNDLCYIPLDNNYPIYDKRIIIKNNIKSFDKDYAIWYTCNTTCIAEKSFDGYYELDICLNEFIRFTKWVNEQLN